MKKIILIVSLFIPIIIKGISTSAQSAILMDTDNNRIIYSKNIHEVRSVASISKIMTAVLAIESGKLDEEVKINSVIKKAYGSAIYIKIGEKMKLKDLVYGLMLRSGNDAALAIADYVGSSVDNFVSMMNHKANEIGMKNSKFNNPSGLDEDKANYSTAYDMAILTSYAMKLNDYKKIVKTKEYKLNTNKNNYMWKNKNKLLKLYKYTTGGKTGYTKKAKRTLVTTATKNKVNLVAVTLNDGNDFLDHIDMFNFGFENYKSYNILKKGVLSIYDEKYYKKYNLYVKKNFNYILSNDETSLINIKYNIVKKKKIKNNDKVGEVIVKLGDEKIYNENIYAKKKNIIKSKKWFLW